MSPYIHISRPGQSAEDADRMIAAGKEMGKFRQCSLGYHDECSDPEGDRCTCLCHSVTEQHPDECYCYTQPSDPRVDPRCKAHDREVVGPQKDRIVCPFCGMSTWFQGRCALPGCEGHG